MGNALDSLNPKEAYDIDKNTILLNLGDPLTKKSGESVVLKHKTKPLVIKLSPVVTGLYEETSKEEGEDVYVEKLIADAKAETAIAQLLHAHVPWGFANVISGFILYKGEETEEFQTAVKGSALYKKNYDKTWVTVEPLLTRGTLSDVIEANELSAEDMKKLLYLSGFALHKAQSELGFLYSDVKPANILVEELDTPVSIKTNLMTKERPITIETRYLPRLSDFAGGLFNHELEFGFGTPGYRGWDNINGVKSDASTDYFAFASTAMDVLTGKVEYVNNSLKLDDTDDIIQKITTFVATTNAEKQRTKIEIYDLARVLVLASRQNIEFGNTELKQAMPDNIGKTTANARVKEQGNKLKDAIKAVAKNAYPEINEIDGLARLMTYPRRQRLAENALDKFLAGKVFEKLHTPTDNPDFEASIDVLTGDFKFKAKPKKRKNAIVLTIKADTFWYPYELTEGMQDIVGKNAGQYQSSKLRDGSRAAIKKLYEEKYPYYKQRTTYARKESTVEISCRVCSQEALWMAPDREDAPYCSQDCYDNDNKYN